MKWNERAAWASLAAGAFFLLTLPWAYEILRPLRDAADPNEFLWTSLASLAAVLAVVFAWLPGASRRVRIMATGFLALLVVLLLAWVYVLMFLTGYGT